ncbi:MAG TPA: sulfatase [Isosphaeraceae bacterium]|nr:sulfatase [Isosphaeraceae bacterium]
MPVVTRRRGPLGTKLRSDRTTAARPIVEDVRVLSEVVLAAWCGLVAGWLELGVVLAQRATNPRITLDSLRTNRHFVWMIPLSNLLIFCALGLLIGWLARYRPRFARALGWRAYVALAALALLMTIEGLYPSARLVLACGIGNWFGPVVARLGTGFPRFRRLSQWVMTGGLAVLAAVWSGRAATAERRAWSHLPPAAPGAPNVLLIVLDNVRAASMSLYGYERPTTPNLQGLAGQGTWFTQAFATAPWTLPSHASMFTGQWCHQLSVSWDRALDATYPTLAEFLAGHGYTTAGFVANTYYCNARYGLDRGFARYEDYYENQTVSPFEVAASSGLGKLLLGALGIPTKVFEDARASVRKSAAMINRDILDWLDARPLQRPFFAFLNYFDAHSAFNPPEGPDPRFGLAALPKKRKDEILSRYKKLMVKELVPGDGPPEQIEREAVTLYRDSYESCIAYLDRNIGRLFNELRRRGLLENTLVIVTSDHGEHFMEHGFMGHGLSLYRREVQVPLLIFPPAGTPAGRRVEEPVSLRDLPATILDLIRLGDRSPFPGQSLARFCRSETTAPRSRPVPLLCEVGHQQKIPRQGHIPATMGPLQSIVAEGRVYIRNHDGREELFDLLNDPLEQHNLSGQPSLRPALDHFRGLLDQLLAPSGPPR